MYGRFHSDQGHSTCLGCGGKCDQNEVTCSDECWAQINEESATLDQHRESLTQRDLLTASETIETAAR